MRAKLHWRGAESVSGHPGLAPGERAGVRGERALPCAAVQGEAVRRLVLGAAFAFLAFRLAHLGLAYFLSPAAAVDLLLDDAYYYLQIAHNVGVHGRSTFDGVTLTNGYQPAWMALLVAVQLLFQPDKHGLFVATQALILVSLALPLAFCLVRRRDSFHLGLAAGLLISYSAFPGVYLAGLETVLFAPAFVAVVHAARCGLRRSAPRVAWIFALIVLIRLDAVSLLVAYAVPLAWSFWRNAGPRRAALCTARFLLPSLASLGLYAFVNQLAFGQPVPVSGLAKSLGAPLFANWGILYEYLLQGVPLEVSLCVLLAVELLWGKFQRARFLYGGMGVLLGSLVVHYLYFATFSGFPVWPWYFYGEALLLVLVGARLVAVALDFSRAPRFTRPRQRVVLGALVFGVLLFPAAFHAALGFQAWENERQGGVPSGSFNRRNAADALLFAASAEPLRVAMGDRAAGLGYWAPDSVQVFALEGLVSGRAYLDARRRDEGAAWVRDHFQPKYLIVDREQLELVHYGEKARYVVIVPIQGRVMFDHLITYCFPERAVVRALHARDDQIFVLRAPAVRFTFDLAQAETCQGPFAAHAQRAIFAPESLRRSGVGGEYTFVLGGELNAALERFDRALGLRLRAAPGDATRAR